MRDQLTSSDNGFLIHQVGIVAINVIGDVVRKQSDPTDPVSVFTLLLLISLPFVCLSLFAALSFSLSVVCIVDSSLFISVFLQLKGGRQF